jgi:hypothetical protein
MREITKLAFAINSLSVIAFWSVAPLRAQQLTADRRRQRIAK